MGSTGAGKSTFVNAVSGKAQATVGHEIDACTKNVQEVTIDDPDILKSMYPQNARLHIVDTPGFDSCTKDDEENLKTIEKWLKESYGLDALLGIIYLQDISLARCNGTAKRNLQMFKNLCGKKALRNVVFGLTKGGRVNDPELLKTRTESFKHTEGRHTKGEGVEAEVFHVPDVNSTEHSRKVVTHLLTCYCRSIVLHIQNEFIQKRIPVPNIKAGQELSMTIKQLLDAQKRYSQFSTATNLEEARQATNSLSTQLKKLKVPLSKRILRFFGF
ncbi:hypothetical protein JR316_0000034 [Psilocybe cubensis]|uniref:Uncharacterized protein n=2 Tax=Psilocybe cubensis TaxID=181762 RepID=A0ACB8HE39_PSICU|nr:hypothetical protein JR316_0000034 [Psilocybe cubensis]KAH9485972.1 hypothetical protein JR316_0000034 [Psilocybe cubensis]